MITKTPEERKQACIEDLSLARQAAAGNDDAFSVIVDRYSRLVYNVALRSVSSPEDAADISQDTFLKAWRSIGSFRGDCALSTWLCRIALNCCCDHARSAKRHRVLSLTVREEDEESKVLDIPDTDVTAMPEEELTRQTEIDAVRAAIDALPEDQKMIITMRDITGLSYAEIAEALGLEMGTVKSRINRARGNVKKFLIERNLFT
jgi:RNA polymerase sigma-70 factor (ECF subfamily)